MTLLLRRSEVADLMDLRQAMCVLDQTFREQADGKVKQVPPLRFMNRGMRMVVGGLEVQDKNGLRVSVTGGESMALLFEISSGKLISVMGYPFSNLRISATVALAIDRLSSSKVKSIALIGSGRLAMPVLEPTVAVRRITRVFVYSRNSLNRESFARKASEKLKLSVTAVESPRAAIDQAEVVLVSTNSPEPALRGQWLRPGLSIFGVGRPNEFDDDVYLRADLICVTSKTHELGYYDAKLDQPLIRLDQQGRISWDSVAEFSDLLVGKAPVPDVSYSLVVFRDSQGGYGDVALASWVYEEARKRGLGQQISME
jgi:alanine dehydrogenase